MVYNGRSVGRIGTIPGQHAPQTKPVQQDGSFEKIFREKIGEARELKFSKHAEMRLQSRNISLSAEQMEKINEAVERAEQKGVRDSLILMDRLALVVNIRSKTVITAVNNDELRENVFTNIDGAVIA